MKKKILPLVLLICVLLGSMLLPAAADSLDEDISDARQDIDDNDRKAKDAEEKKKKYEALEAELTAELEQLQTELDAVEASLADLEVQMQEISDAAEELDERRASVEEALEERRQDMKLRIRYMYERGSSSWWDVISGSGSLSELLNAADYIASINRYDREKIDEFREEQKVLERVMRDREIARAELEAVEAEVSASWEAMHLRSTELLEKIKEYHTLAEENGAAQAYYIEKTAQAEALLQKLQAEAEAEAARRKAEEEAALAAKKAAEEAEAARRRADELNSRGATGQRGVGSVAIDGSWMNPSGYTNLELLACIIHCEGGGQPYEGKIAIANVILNRILSPKYQMTLYDVIYATGQFTPVKSGRLEVRLAQGASKECLQAAQDALNGARVLGEEYLYFRRNTSTLDKSKYKQWTVIGDHCFH